MIERGVEGLLVASILLTAACGASPPATAPPACPATTPLVAGISTPARAALAELETLRDRACACPDPDCLLAVHAEFTDFLDRNASTRGTETEAVAAGQVAEQLAGCLAADLAGDEPPPPDGPVTGMEDCDALIGGLEQYAACEHLTPESRDGAHESIAELRASWGDPSAMSPDARTSANDACRQAVDALRQGASALGCAIAP